MKFKLTHAEFKAVYGMLASLTILEGMRTLSNDGLQHTILLGVYEKFYQQAVRKKKQYSINLKAHEAMAFWLWFADNELPVISFEGTTLSKITNSIHQKFQ